MKVFCFIILTILCLHSVALAESYLNNWEVQGIPQSSQDIMGLTAKMAKWQNCINQSGTCIMERCNWQFCQDTIEGPPAGYECNYQMSALQQCLQLYANEQKELNCSRLSNEFNNAFRDGNADLCRHILRSSQHCDWNKKASVALYNATKGPDIPSVAQSRPTKHYTCSGHKFECRERYSKQFYRYWNAAVDLNMDGNCDICGRKTGKGLRTILRGDYICR